MPSSIVNVAASFLTDIGGMAGSVLFGAVERSLEEYVLRSPFIANVFLGNAAQRIAQEARAILLKEVRVVTQGLVKALGTPQETSILDLSSIQEFFAFFEANSIDSEQNLKEFLSNLEKRGCEFAKELGSAFEQPINESSRLEHLKAALTKQIETKIQHLSNSEKEQFCQKFFEVTNEPFQAMTSMRHLRGALISLYHLGVIQWSSISISFIDLEKSLKFAEESCFFEVGPDGEPSGIGYVNGINTPLEVAKEQASFVSALTHQKVHGVFLGYNGAYQDAFHVLAGQPYDEKRGVLTEAEVCLLKVWEAFFEKHPDKTFLQVCFSGGSTTVYNALHVLPEPWRKKILVVTLAPSTVIPQEERGHLLCRAVHNYIAEGDIFGDIAAQRQHIDNPDWGRVLHPDGSSTIHAFNAEHFREALTAEVDAYRMTGNLAVGA